MSVVVDSCGWIEYLVGGRLADAYAPLLEAEEELVVPTVVQYEVYRWVRREASESLALEIVAHMERGRVRPLDSRTALLAADLAAEHRLAMADAMVYAHAHEEDALLLTSDAHFDGLRGVRLLPKG